MRAIYCGLLVCWVGLSGVQAQTMFRCVDGAGKVTFTDSECVGTRTAIKAPVVSIGDGGAARAKVAQVKGEAKFELDFAMRKYREASERVVALRAALDSNTADKYREMESIREERRKCDFHKIGTLKCQAFEAMQPSDIESKWHAIWMRDHRDWTMALKERSAAEREVVARGGKVPAE